MIEWWGPVIFEYYGSTETGGVVFCDSKEWLAHPGTVGKPMPGADVRVIDAEGRSVPTGETGEVVAKFLGIAGASPTTVTTTNVSPPKRRG